MPSLRAAIASMVGDDGENILTSGCKIIRSNNGVLIQTPALSSSSLTFLDPHSVRVANATLALFVHFTIVGTHGCISLLNSNESVFLTPPDVLLSSARCLW